MFNWIQNLWKYRVRGRIAKWGSERRGDGRVWGRNLKWLARVGQQQLQTGGEAGAEV